MNENGLLGASKSAIEKGGGRRVGRLVPNPGWLPIDPNQRLGHEAPARLGSSQPKVDSTGDSPNEKDNKGKGKAGAKNKSSTTSRGGMANEAKSSDSQQPYQKSRTAGDKTLRTLQSTLEPTPPKSNAPKTPGRNKAQDPNQPKKSNLQDGTPFRTPGKVWRGNSDNSEVATHYGAPVQGINTETRMPPRPQNLKGYKEQLSKQEKHEATKEKAQTEASKAASKAGVLPASSKTAKTDKYEQNLAKFNTQHPVKANNIASGRPSEAPARMNPAAQGRPSVNEQRPVSPSGPWTPNRNARPGGASSPPLTPSRPGLAVRPRPNAGSGNTGPSQGISGPSTPPQISQGQRRNPPRKTDSRKKLRKRMIEQALVRDLDLRDFHFLL